tara:strand:+ start:1020 stop:1340 length:321 start_codon:yes stop_codon:yes gene_type:complete
MSLLNKRSRFDLVPGETPGDIVPKGETLNAMEHINGSATYNSLNGTSQSPFTYNSKVSPADYLVALLDQAVKSSNTGQVYQPSPNSSDFQDLNGVTPSKYTDNLPK